MSLFGNKKRKEESPFAGMNTAQAPPEVKSFEQELTELCNRYSLEALSNTPDFILAYYLKDCLLAFNNAQQRRKEWFAAREESKHRESQMSPLE